MVRPAEPQREPDTTAAVPVTGTETESCRVPAGVVVEPIAGRYVDRVADMRRAVSVAFPFSGALTPEPHEGAVAVRSSLPAPAELSQCYSGWLDVITLEGDVPEQLCVTLTLTSEGPLPVIDVLHSRGMPTGSGGCVDGDCSTSLCVALRDRTDTRIVISGMMRSDEPVEPYLLRIE